MRGVFRVINVLVWAGIWLAVAVNFNALNDPPRMFGEAIIPAILCFIIDRGLRRRKVAEG